MMSWAANTIIKDGDFDALKKKKKKVVPIYVCSYCHGRLYAWMMKTDKSDGDKQKGCQNCHISCSKFRMEGMWELSQYLWILAWCHCDWESETESAVKIYI